MPFTKFHFRLIAILCSLMIATLSTSLHAADEPTKTPAHAWSFRNDIQPIMTKMSCNSGACHGAVAGKGGFRLSLRGFDTFGDYHNIVKQSRGRRVELAAPARSLFLTKPTAAIRHKGGVRFDVGSKEYKIISEWIANGAPPPNKKDVVINRLEVLPKLSLLKPGSNQQIKVRAFYSDKSSRDVTRWTRFTSTNQTVANVNEQGKVSVTGYGEGAVLCQYSSKVIISRVTSPYPNQIKPAVYNKAPQRNFIDKLVLKQLQRMNIAPSPQANDSQFLRRVYIDTIGTLPTSIEAKKFLADKSPDKRDQLIEALLKRSEFVDYWSYKWSDLFLINGGKLKEEEVKGYYTWINQHVKKNTPWDVMVRELITAQGEGTKNGATNFYAIHQDPESVTENISQAFLGLSIGCAKCHNHPLEKWTNDQYYAMANMFARVRSKGWGGRRGSGGGNRTVYVASSGDLIQPLTGKPQPPAALGQPAIDILSPEDRRVYLANWVTSPQNKMFSRTITNRIWANYFGVGLVESVDDMRESNPASNEELLTATSEYLVKNKFNLKALMRLILQSKTYQTSSITLPENKDEKRFYSHYYPRRMMAEVLLDSISQVTAVPDNFNESFQGGGSVKKTKLYPKGTRAIQLYDSAVVSKFLDTFGRNERIITCACERTAEPSIGQVLHISNGTTINDKLKNKDCRITKLMASKKSDDVLLEEIYLESLSRRPTEKEKIALLKILKETPVKERRIVIEDVLWGIMSSREFLFNH